MPHPMLDLELRLGLHRVPFADDCTYPTMLNLHAILLDAADKATAARDAARAALAVEVAPPSAERISAALAMLPDAVAKALSADPEATTVDVLDMVTRADKALGVAVTTYLLTYGVEVTAHSCPPFKAHNVTTLRVNIPSLLAASAKLRETAHLDAFTLAWQALAGESAPVTRNVAAGTLIVGTSSLGSGALGGDLYTLGPHWTTCPVATLVEEARQALRLPRWTLDGLTAAWQATADRLSLDGSATVDLVPGYHRGTLYRPISAVAFHGCEAGPIYLDVDDARDLTAAEVVAKVIAEAGLDVSAPVTTPTGEAPSPVGTPLLTAQTPHLSRAERRRLGQRASV